VTQIKSVVVVVVVVVIVVAVVVVVVVVVVSTSSVNKRIKQIFTNKLGHRIKVSE
jgi:hypothetical protein